MRKVTDDIYNHINNFIYNTDEAGWWDNDSPLNLLKVLLNPVRVKFIRKNLFERLSINPLGKNALEVGCGGGILCEEIAKMGFITSGIDPSKQAVQEAIEHAKGNDLFIKYIVGSGEELPFADKSFDLVFCCDVLEHVQDLSKVISEISRVLKLGGIFFYDTLNRTMISKLVVIKVLQEWKVWAILPPNLHIWDMLIRPDELKSLLQQNNLQWKEHRGIEPDISVFRILGYLYQRAKGKISYMEFGNKFSLIEGNSLRVSYMGYALK
jgi:2-polyprenyl-6-hydroxyphenyl methylase / 3-demethylubiquinone-9 3-methyltransferase